MRFFAYGILFTSLCVVAGAHAVSLQARQGTTISELPGNIVQVLSDADEVVSAPADPAAVIVAEEAELVAAALSGDGILTKPDS